jgi:hypothetical protein
MQKKGIKIDMAGSDKLNASYEKLFTMEREFPSKIKDLKIKMEDELKKIIGASDNVIFEYESLKDKIVALVGEQGAKSWDASENGKKNYSIAVKKTIENFRKNLIALNYKG